MNPTVESRSLFHEATSPVIKGENTSQNDSVDWSLFHGTSDK
jgi:hypothetical protein